MDFTKTRKSFGSALRPPINIKLSYYHNYQFRSNILISRIFFGLYEQQRTDFSFELISTKNPSVVILINISFEGISSRIYRSILSLLPLLSSL